MHPIYPEPWEDVPPVDMVSHSKAINVVNVIIDMDILSSPVFTVVSTLVHTRTPHK
jgi:hypothetical protein